MHRMVINTFAGAYMELYLLSVEKALQYQKYGAYLIDVRPKSKYLSGHIKDAINIPYEDMQLFLKKVKSLNKSRRYVLYCQKGATSLAACDTMRQLGFMAYSMRDGYKGYLMRQTH